MVTCPSPSLDPIPVTRPPEGRSDHNKSRFLLLGLHHMAGTTCFTSESVPGGHVGVLRMCAHRHEGQDCSRRQAARDRLVHRLTVSVRG
jgi:hypothetical protein